MTLETEELLEEKISVLEFKLELVLKLTKTDVNLTLEGCKTMVEFAFIMNLKKDEFNAINDLLETQINFHKGYRQDSYVSPRQYSKYDDNLDVFNALSKDEYEQSIWKLIPKLDGNQNVCKKIAKINGISDMYYEDLATKIKKEKHSRLDKEAKLLDSYTENKNEVDKLYKDIDSLNRELQSNLKQVDDIIEFFKKNELVKISIFYNGELWDKSEDDKRVVVNEDSYIHNVCKTETSEVLDVITQLLKDKKNDYKDILIHLLKSGPTSSRKIADLQSLYKTMNEYNKNEHVQIDEINSLKELLESKAKIVEDILNNYHDYINSI